MLRTTTVLLAVSALTLASACDDGGNAASDPTAALTAPLDGDRIAGPVDVEMAASGVAIVPAGEVTPGEGHFHVIADHDCLAPGTAIGKDADHVHFGTGASTGTIYLEPGTHSLCLQVGDGEHVALSATDSIEIEVGISSEDEFCDVLADTDSLMTTLETSEEAWPVQQVGFENVRRLLTQLAAGLDHVDEEARADVDELVHWATVIAETMAAGESAESAADELWGPDGILPADADLSRGERWALDTCGVSVSE